MSKPKWRLYADNNIEFEIVDYLRQRNFDILWISEIPKYKRQIDDSFHYHEAKRLGRFLLTRDLDFWDDEKHILKESPGVILLSIKDIKIAKLVPDLFRRLILEYGGFTNDPILLNGVKIKLDSNGFIIRMLDFDNQKVSSNRWEWKDL